MQKVRWGILGAAKIAREWVCPASRPATAASSPPSPAARRARPTAFAARYGARIHDSYEALLADPEIDAIYNPLPNSAHVEWTLKALDAGKHVLTEKPIALGPARSTALIAARDRAGKLAAEAFMVTHHPQWLRARELVQGGAIGRLAPGAGRRSAS